MGNSTRRESPNISNISTNSSTTTVPPSYSKIKSAYYYIAEKSKSVETEIKLRQILNLNHDIVLDRNITQIIYDKYFIEVHGFGDKYELQQIRDKTIREFVLKNSSN